MADRRPIVNRAQPSELQNADSLNVGGGLIIKEQSVSLPTPASGYGALFCKADGFLYFINDSGIETRIS